MILLFASSCSQDFFPTQYGDNHKSTKYERAGYTATKSTIVVKNTDNVERAITVSGVEYKIKPARKVLGFFNVPGRLKLTLAAGYYEVKDDLFDSGTIEFLPGHIHTLRY